MPRKTAPPEDRPSAMDLLDPAPDEQRGPDAGTPDEEPREPGPYQLAVERDLARLPADLAGGAVAAGMLRLAMEIDAGLVFGRDVSGHVREIRQSYSALRELAPAAGSRDKTDEVTARREARLSRQAAR